jgi:hypothetical protein
MASISALSPAGLNGLSMVRREMCTAGSLQYAPSAAANASGAWMMLLQVGAA